jgi:hypothetical protein
VMERDSRRMRGELPFFFANLRDAIGLDSLVKWVEQQVNSPRGSRSSVIDAHAPYTGMPHSHGHGDAHTHEHDPHHSR